MLTPFLTIQGDDPAVQCAEGYALYEEYRDDEALPLLESGFYNRANGHFIQPYDLGVCAFALGDLYEARGSIPDALTAYQVALQAFSDGNNSDFEIITLANIGSIYETLGDYSMSLAQYEKGFIIAQGTENRDYQGQMLINISKVEIILGRYAQATENFQWALVLMREAGDRQREGDILSYIAAIYFWQGLYDEALEYYQEELTVRLGANDRIGESSVYTNIGNTYLAQRKYTEALTYFQNALFIMQEVGYPKGEGVTLSSIGEIYILQERYDEALELFEQALIIEQEIDDRHNEGFVLANIGTALSLQGRYAEGVNQYRQALAIMQEFNDRATAGDILISIGFIYQEMERYIDAQYYYEQGMTMIESVRSTVGNDAARSSFFDQFTNNYDHIIKFYYEQNQAEIAYLTTERGRARTFLDVMATGYVKLNDSSASLLYAQEQEAYAIRQAAWDALSRARAQNPPDTKLETSLEAELVQAETNYQDVLDAITARDDQLSQLVSGCSTALDLTQTQALIDDRTTLISFWVLDEQTLAFILTNNTFNTVSLNIKRSDLLAQIESFRMFANIDTPQPESAITLYHALIEPILPYLFTTNLVIIPHDGLHYLPFAALTDGNKYLVEDYTITYLPSVSAWPYIQQNTERSGGQPLILGNPSSGNEDLIPLPFAESEARTIARLFEVTPLLGSDATEGAVRSQSSQANILHLGAHGSYNSINPLYSSIFLAPDGENDGLLEVHEVYGLDLGQADLVVLSGCETQLGELSTGDDVVGLTRAFMFAGTPSVLASLWSVDDQATQLLMERFYSYWQGGISKADALRQAQLDVRAEYPNPYYWAGFVLSGDGGEGTRDIGIQPGNMPIPTFLRNPSFLLVLSICLCSSFGGGLTLFIVIGVVFRHKKK